MLSKDIGKGGEQYELLHNVLDFYARIMSSSVQMESHDQKKAKEEEKKGSPTKKPAKMFLDMLNDEEENKKDKEPVV